MTETEAFDEWWGSLVWWLRWLSHKELAKAAHECGYLACEKEKELVDRADETVICACWKCSKDAKNPPGSRVLWDNPESIPPGQYRIKHKTYLCDACCEEADRGTEL